ncbi:MAG: hypothetical protein JWN24_1936 [Phycisphaerales bacterium]|nr:hypothetical protein [Phycisphaerales bacterium]
MLRRLFTLLSALSLLLCVVTCVLWVRSDHYYHSLRWITRYVPSGSDGNPRWVDWRFFCVNDEFGFKREEVEGVAGMERPPICQLDPEPYPIRFHVVYEHVADNLSASVGIWLIFLLTIAAPLIWGIRFTFAKRRFVVGKCAVCGYDLRATPERCPECGAVPTTAKVNA